MQWLSVDDLRREHFHQVWQSNTSIPCAMGDIAKSVFATEVLKHPFLHACRIGFAGETTDVSIHAYGTLKGYMYETLQINLPCFSCTIHCEIGRAHV